MKKSKETAKNYKDMMKKTDPKSEYFKPFKLSLDKNEKSKKFSVRLLPTYEDKFLKIDDEEMNLAIIAKRYWDTFEMKKRKIVVFDKPVISRNSFFLTGNNEEHDDIFNDIFDFLRTVKDAGGDEKDQKVVTGLLPKDVYFSVAMIDGEVVVWGYPKTVFDMIMEFNDQIINETEDGEEYFLINDARHGRVINVTIENKAVGWDYRVTMASKESDAFPDKTDEEVDEILRDVDKVAEKSEIVGDEYLNNKFKKFLSIIENGFGIDTSDNEDKSEDDEEEEAANEESEESTSKKNKKSIIEQLRDKK